jgi:ABC-type branched-subunit amino acid transport system permease subunit
MTTTRVRRGLVLLGILAASGLPAHLSEYYRALCADAVITGILVLSLVVLTGLVGQISFCQFSFAVLGALTVGCLTGGHGWSFWISLPLGVLLAAAAGVLVGLPALRLRGLFLAVLTVSVALFFDRFVLEAGTWDAFTGGLLPWTPARPSIGPLHLDGEYAYYVFTLGVLLLSLLVVWNLRRSRAGRMLQAVRDSEVAASTLGIDVVAWKLTAFALSAALAGLAGGLMAVRLGSVSAGSYDFLHSVQLAAIATVVGTGSLASAPLGGALLVFFPVLLHQLQLPVNLFPLILGVALVAQIVLTPEGAVTRIEDVCGSLLRRRAARWRAGTTEAG